MEKWLKTAKKIDTIEVEICFLLRNAFEEEKVEPLPSLATPRDVLSMVRTSEIESNVDELARYYANVVYWARHHNLPFNRIRSYFWMRLWLWNSEEEVSVGFPWYDTLCEMERFFDALETQEDGEVYNDIDQGWEFVAYKAKDDLVLLERDSENPDDSESQVLIRVSHEMLLQKVRPLRERAKRIIEQLTHAVGHDCWTRYTEWPELQSDTLPPFNVPFTAKKRSWWQKLWWPR